MSKLYSHNLVLNFLKNRKHIGDDEEISKKFAKNRKYIKKIINRV